MGSGTFTMTKSESGEGIGFRLPEISGSRA